jgi:hypothetical protein
LRVEPAISTGTWGEDMADNSGGNGGLYFIVGALVVVVVLLVVFVSGNGNFPFFGSKHVDVKISGPSTPASAPASK